MASSMRLTKALQPISAARQALRPHHTLRPDCCRQSVISSYRRQQQPQLPAQPLIRSCCAVRHASTPLVQQDEAALLSYASSSPFSHRRTLTTTARQLKTKQRAHNNEEIPDGPPTTDFSRMDMLSQAPAPSTSVDICSSDGFALNSGVSVYDGKGVVLVGGEAFEWQPWGADKRLVNNKGQWEVPEEAFGMFDLVWPRPDLLILGLGPSMLPLSPATKKYLSSLGLRVEVLDTRNAASQFNLLATERGIEEVAAALIPIGWKEGMGANHYK